MAEVDSICNARGRDPVAGKEAGEDFQAAALQHLARGDALLDQLGDSLAFGVLAGPPAQRVAHPAHPSTLGPDRHLGKTRAA